MEILGMLIVIGGLLGVVVIMYKVIGNALNTLGIFAEEDKSKFNNLKEVLEYLKKIK